MEEPETAGGAGKAEVASGRGARLRIEDHVCVRDGIVAAHGDARRRAPAARRAPPAVIRRVREVRDLLDRAARGQRRHVSGKALLLLRGGRPRRDVHLGLRAVGPHALGDACLAHVLEVDERVVGRPRAEGADEGVVDLLAVYEGGTKGGNLARDALRLLLEGRQQVLAQLWVERESDAVAQARVVLPRRKEFAGEAEGAARTREREEGRRRVPGCPPAASTRSGWRCRRDPGRRPSLARRPTGPIRPCRRQNHLRAGK